MANKLTAREQNAAKQSRYRARKKAAAVTSASPTPPQTTGGAVPLAGAQVVPPVGEEDTLQVDVNTPTTSPQLSLKERFMNRLQGKTPTSTTATSKPKGRATGGKKADTNLLTTVLPTVIASLVAVYAQNLMPDDYKACAPSKEEVSGVLGPLFDIIGRRVEVIGKASQDAIDVMNSLICAFMYGTRAYITYMDIKKSKENPAYVETQQKEYREKLEREAAAYNRGNDNTLQRTGNESDSLAGGLRGYQTTAIGRGRDGDSGSGSTAHEYATKDDVERLYPTSEDGDTERRSAEAALVNDLFKRDRGGRVRLGLLPG